jgi:hypothetical protein
MTRKLHHLGAFAAALALIAACSGGDGEPGNFIGNNPPPPPTGQLVTITEDNATTVAGVAAEQIVEDNLIGVLTSTGIPVVGAGSAAATEMLSLSGSPLAPGLAAAQLPRENCAVSGTVDVTFSVANPQAISPGDQFSFEFDACDDGAGAVVSGGLAMTVSGFDGDPASEAFYLAVDVELSAFSVTQDGMTSGASGTVSVAIDSRQPPVTTITVTASALTVTHGDVTETVTDLSVTVVEDQSMFPSAVSIQTSLRLSTPRLGGEVIISTSVALQSVGEEYPYGGEISIGGDADASINLIALDGNSVRLEIDLDGDGSPDVTIDTTWTELMAEAEAA